MILHGISLDILMTLHVMQKNQEDLCDQKVPLLISNLSSRKMTYDLRHSGDPLSWRVNQYSHTVRCRLDRSMANSMWSEIFPIARCSYLRFKGSNHKPVITYFEPARRRRKWLFRYDRRLRDNEEVKRLVESKWREARNRPVNHPISLFRKAIIKWNKAKETAASK